MNKILIIVGGIVFVCFNIICINNYNTQGTSGNHDTLYHVYKIDSINNFYLIYAYKRGAKYKIVSQKRHCEINDKILKNGYYDFDLFSIIYGSEDLPLHPGSVGSIKVDSLTIISLEDSIYDLFSAKNVKGLCFIKEK